MTKHGTMFERYGGIAFVAQFVLKLYDRAGLYHPCSVRRRRLRRLVDIWLIHLSVMGGPAQLQQCCVAGPRCPSHRSMTGHSTMIRLFRSLRKPDYRGRCKMIIADLNAHRIYRPLARKATIDLRC